MSAERPPSTSREDHLHMILHRYLQAVDAGQPRPREELLREHPELAAELAADCQLRKQWFAARWHLERLLNLPAPPTGAPGPSRAELLSRLGAALYRTGHFKAAVQRLDEARQARGEGFTPNERLYLAMAHHHLGHAAEARQWLDRTKELFEKAQGRELEVADRARLAQSVLFEWQSTSELFLEAMSLLSGKATQPKP